MKSSSLLLVPLGLLLLVVLSSEVVNGESQDAAGVNYFFAPPPPRRRPPSGASEAPRKVMRLAGGWKPIGDVADPHVVEVGKFAVSEHNGQSKSRLVFVRVVKGETQVVAGTNYRLVVETKYGSNVENCEAVVWEKVGETSTMQLISFKFSSDIH